VTDPLVSAFYRLRARRPEQPLLWTPGRAAVTVSDLANLAEALALRLGEARVPPGSLVGAACATGVGLLACVIALRRHGAIVQLLEPMGPLAHIREAASALGARAIVACEEVWPNRADAFRIELLAPEASAPALPPAAGFVKMTSGSTGRPRGVAVSCEAMLADEAALSATMRVSGADRIVAAIPMAHSYGFASVALPALVRGATLVLPDAASPLHPLVAAHEAEATVFPTAPAYLGALIRMSSPPAWPASVRLVVSAGAPLSAETAARFRAVYGRGVHVFYGASECGGICFDREGGAAERGSVGTPVEGVRVDLEPLGNGEGLVTVASPALGLTHVPTAEPRLSGGSFQTSDVARWCRGELQLLRRTDAVINVKGKKVDPSEIEATLAGLLGVEEVVALGVPEGETQVLRVVIACREGRLTSEEVLRFCRSRLAEHQVPRSIRLVPEIPRTARGKIDRGELLRG
jgi:acyl-coenzyme A synthetase/AMP-(fatty) acid ligase